MKVLVTGAAGFIGSFVAQKLLDRGDSVLGLDNLNHYYDPLLKYSRLSNLKIESNFSFAQIDLADAKKMADLFKAEQFDRVVHLGAQAGVRYSLDHPQSYVDSNITGTLNVLEGCRHNQVEHLVFASTSSVYGANSKMPFSVHQAATHPLSFYAATKRANELMAHNYAALFGLPVTGLRFFTVYGPWGRPDMALFKFTKNILNGNPIEVFNNGHHKRDFTYVLDIAEGVVKALDKVATPNPNWSSFDPDPATSSAPYRIYNIGNNRPIELTKYIEVIEACVGIKAHQIFLPMQPGDVPDTWADVSDLIEDVGYQPSTPIEEGVKAFVEWYRDFYNV